MVDYNEVLVKGVQQNNFKMVSKALDNGVDLNYVDKNGKTPLSWAIKTPKMSNMKKLGARKSWIMTEQKLSKLVA